MAMNTRLLRPSREKDALGNEPKGGTLAVSFSSDRSKHKDRKKRAPKAVAGCSQEKRISHLFLSLLSTSLYIMVTPHPPALLRHSCIYIYILIASDSQHWVMEMKLQLSPAS